MLWKQLFNQVTEWDPTIKHALKVTSVISVMGLYQFKGTWPEATFFCRGMFIGHEMFGPGDTVRLLPYPDQTYPIEGFRGPDLLLIDSGCSVPQVSTL